MWNKLPFSRDLHSKVDLFRMRVLHFKLWRPAILQPVDLGKAIIPFWKALSSWYCNLEWKLEYLGFERLQTNFSEGGAFLVNWAWRPLDDATPSFFMNSKSSMLGLSNDISLVSFCLLEGCLNGQNKKYIISCLVCFLHHCTTNEQDLQSCSEQRRQSPFSTWNALFQEGVIHSKIGVKP